MAEHPPTAEQQNAIDLYRTGKSLKIEAGAGTGKTSTLILLAEADPNRSVQYVAFNKAIVTEAGEKMPANVRCNTAHSLAFRAIGKQYAKRIQGSRRLKSYEMANILGIDPVAVTTWTNEKKTLSPAFLATQVMGAIRRFCQTADDAPNYRHMPYIENLDAPPNPNRPTSYAVNNAVGRALEPAMREAWRDLRLFDGALRFEHDHYLKMWQLGGPRIYTDVILFDEAQDANPVMTAIVAAQEHAQIVWVGDSQQQIYTFTGAVNALASIPADQTAYLTQSFRFGQPIADVANLVLATLNAPLRLKGYDKITSKVEELDRPDAILTRTNAAAIRNVLTAQRDGLRPHLVGGGRDVASFARAAQQLMQGGRTDHPELACFSTWQEVIEYVDQDDEGKDLQLMVRLVEEFGVTTILEAIELAVPENRADVIVSTAHKSKGRQWSKVTLGGDFPDDKVGDEERRLLYVAATRAQHVLDLTAVPFLANLLEPPTEGAEDDAATAAASL